MKTGFVYIMASPTRTTYVGVTSQLERRVWEHKTHFYDGFTKEHGCTQLVYIAEFPRMDDAIAWEKVIKGKTRQKKLALIANHNPRWNDLAWNWFDDGAQTPTPSSSASHGDSSASPSE
jgi:predicted GIY-YIG superfamily endonuclease